MALTLAPGVADRIRAYAREAYPDECCGAMLGRSGTVTEALALQNTTDEGARRRFRVGPADYRAAEARAVALGVELLGFYHSHPDAPARPSAYDREHAWPVFSYVILAVPGGSPGDLTSWRLSPDRDRFDEEALRVG